MSRTIWLVVAASLALAACNKKPTEGGNAAPNAGDAARPANATAPAGPLNPVRKPGLWKHTITSMGRTQTMTMCFDEALSKESAVMGRQMGDAHCRQTALAPIPGGWTFASTCDLGEAGKSSTEGQVTGDFSTRIEMRATSTTTGSSMPQANGRRQMAMTAEWVGPCPAGMAAGAVNIEGMEMPGGVRVSPEMMRRMREAQKAGG